MSRIEQKLSSPVGDEYILRGNAPALAGPVRNSFSFGWTAQEVRLVGADNALQGVLREMARSSGRDNRRFAFLAAGSQQENSLPPRVNTLDDAKAYVRKNIAEGQWEHSGQAAGARMTTLSESQLFGSHGKAKATQASTAEGFWKKSDAASTAIDSTAARPQTPPNLLRTAADAQRHVRIETGKAEHRNPEHPESVATSPDVRSGSVAPVQAEPVPAQEAVKVPSASARAAMKLWQMSLAQQRKVGDLTLILSARGELVDEPKTAATQSGQMEKKCGNPPVGAWITALGTAILIVLLALAFYVWGPRPSSGLRQEALFTAAAPLPAVPARLGLSLETPEVAVRSPPFEAQKNTATATASRSKSKRKGIKNCGANSASGDADAACPTAAQDSRAQELESGPPPIATTSNVTQDDRADETGVREKQSEGVGSQ